MYVAYLNEKRLVEREIPSVMDRHLLIAEIRKRPALWDFANGRIKSRACVPDLWKDVAYKVGSNVEHCKRKWKNLRDAYRAEVKRIETRIESDILKGVYNTKNDYNSKWVFFEPMSFINNSMKRPRLSIEYENSNSVDNDSDELMYEQFHSICDIKLEPQHSLDEDVISLDNGNEPDNTLFNPSKYLDVPPLAANHQSSTISIKNFSEFNRQHDPPNNNLHCNESQYEANPQASDRRPVKISIKNFTECNRPHNEHDNPPTKSKSIQNCDKCCERRDDQMNFLEKLEKEEQHLMTSTRRDITHSKRLDHIGDSDYNFLVSFLPQMKKMSELQNLQFRAKMSDIVLKVLSPSITAAMSPPSTS